jgi:hypothetical protein
MYLEVQQHHVVQDYLEDLANQVDPKDHALLRKYRR